MLKTLFIDFTTYTLCKVETVKRLVYETIRTRTYTKSIRNIIQNKYKLDWKSRNTLCTAIIQNTHKYRIHVIANESGLHYIIVMP